MGDFSFIGKGKLYAGPFGGGAKMRALGNISAFEFTANQEKKELLDFQNAGGGFANTLTRITGVEASLTLHDLNAENIAMALYGTTSATAASAVVDEAITAYKDGLVRTANIIDTSVAPVVTGSGGTPTYVADTDYTVSPAGIFILAAGAITDALPLLIDYTIQAFNAVEAMVNSGQEFVVVMDGLNEAQSGKAVVIDVHRMKFSPGQNIGAIGDDFASMELTADVLKDAAITTPGLSQFLKWSQVEA